MLLLMVAKKLRRGDSEGIAHDATQLSFGDMQAPREATDTGRHNIGVVGKLDEVADEFRLGLRVGHRTEPVWAASLARTKTSGNSFVK